MYQKMLYKNSVSTLKKKIFLSIENFFKYEKKLPKKFSENDKTNYLTFITLILVVFFITQKVIMLKT